ncbi:MAG: MBL fold metallo-hydrolase [Phycisphaerales bacterium]|nr:MBL fold metallo-hydrolase [Phycisphaerales bacterium]
MTAAADSPVDTPLAEAFALGPFATNCYIVHLGHGAEGWLVDASFDPSPMIERVRRLELRISRILLTHAHGDHIAGLDDLRRAFPGVPVSGHQDERAFFDNPSLNLSIDFDPPVRTSPPDEYFKGGEELSLGTSRWKVIHTPGHSPGGVAFHCATARTAIVGDTLFAGSVGRSDFPTSDEGALRRSLRTLCALPDETRILPGHGPATTIGREKMFNPYVRKSL